MDYTYGPCFFCNEDATNFFGDLPCCPVHMQERAKEFQAELDKINRDIDTESPFSEVSE